MKEMRANKFLGSKLRLKNESEKNIQVMRRSIVTQNKNKKRRKITLKNIDFKKDQGLAFRHQN